MPRSVERPFGPGPLTLLVNDQPVAPLAVADSTASRSRGLLGTTEVIGALWITRCPSVHMVGMHYPIDVAVLDRRGTVLRVRTLRRFWGMTRPSVHARSTVETAVGNLARWGVVRGARLSVGPGEDQLTGP